MEGAKNVAKDKAKDFVKGKVKDKVTGRKRKKGELSETGGPGAIVPSQSKVNVATSSGIVVSPSGELVPTSGKSKAQVSPQSVSFSSISKQLESIVGLTESLEKITGQQNKDKKKSEAKRRREKEKEKKRDKEERLESGLGKVAGFLGNKAKEVGQGFGIFNFLKNVFLGFLAVQLLKFAPQILSGIEFFTKNLHLAWVGVKGIGMAFSAMSKGFPEAKKKFGNLLNKAKSPILKGFESLKRGISKIFDAVGEFVPKTVKNAINYGKNAVKAVKLGTQTSLEALRRAATFDTRDFSKLGANKKGLERLEKAGGVGTKSIGITKNVSRIRKLHGDDAARIFQGMVDNGVKPERAQRYINKQIKDGKLTSSPMRGSIGGGVTGSKMLKGGLAKSAKRTALKLFGTGKKARAFARGAEKVFGNIPIVGPLIVAVSSLLAGEPISQALFKGFGAALGGALGTLIPIPIVGTLVGELLGEYVGDLTYTLLLGGGVSALGQKLKDDISAVMSAGQAAVDWIGRGFGRFYEGIPKFKIPDWIPNIMLGPIEGLLNLGGKSLKDFEIPNPVWMMNPFNITDKLGLFWKAFFTDDPVSDGEVKESDKEPPKLTPQEKEEQDPNYPKRGDYSGRDGAKRYKKDVEEYEKQKNVTSPSSPTTSKPPEQEEESKEEIVLGERPGSDSSGLGPLPPADSSSKVDFTPGDGDRSRKIFLHWTAGGYNQSFDNYHTVFLGNGKAVRNTQYGQDLSQHTAGANSGSVGLSLAAMGGKGVNENNFGSNPPTNAQINSMAEEAARLALAWGWDTATVDKNVMTHGEWERYATRNGILSGGPQRWDLDKLKQSDPNVDVSKVKSHGGERMRQLIKSKMGSLKSQPDSKDKKSEKDKVTPTTPPKATAQSVSKDPKDSKPKKEDYAKGRSGAKKYLRDLKAWEDKQGGGDRDNMDMEGKTVPPPAPKSEKKEKKESTKAEVSPKETMTGEKVKPKETEEKDDDAPKRSDFKGRSGAAKYEKAKKEYEKKKSESQSTPPEVTPKETMTGEKVKPKETEEKKVYEDVDVSGIESKVEQEASKSTEPAQVSKPTETDEESVDVTQPTQVKPEQVSASKPKVKPAAVEKQTSYEKPQTGSTAFVPLPQQQPMVSGGGGGSGSPIVSSGDSVNSLYTKQLLGFLYKFG